MALGTIGIQLATVVFIVLWIQKSPLLKKIYPHIPLVLGFLFISSVLGSLIYEYGLGYEPCLLCWYQRIAIFGIAILALTGNILNSKLLQRQILIFSILGVAVAILHNYIDIVPSGLDLCGSGPSCLKRYIHEFGYITIPMMSFTVLFAGTVLALFAKKYSPNSEE